MEEVPVTKLTKQESDFLQQLVDYSKWVPKQGIEAEFADLFPGQEICLASIFFSRIHPVQWVMAYLEPELALEYAQHFIPIILDEVKKWYVALYAKEPRANFSSLLHEFIYNSICLNYNAQAVLERHREIEIEYAYRSGSLRKIRSHLSENQCLYASRINNIRVLSPEKKKAILQKVKESDEQMIADYLSETQRAPLSVKLYVFLAFLMIVGMVWGNVPGLLVALGTFAFAARQVYVERDTREFTATKQASYSRVVKMDLDKLKRAGAFPRTVELIDKAAHRIRHLDLMLLIRELYLIQLYGLKKPVQKQSNHKKSITLWDNSDDGLLYTMFSDNPGSDAYSLENIKKFYVQGKKEGKHAQTLSPAQSSYVRVAETLYKLSPALQKHACLVREGDSIVVCDLGKYLDVLNARDQAKVANNEFSFVGAQGEFGFKYLPNLKQYELKVSGGLRIDFLRQPETQEVDVYQNEDKVGTKKVPLHLAVGKHGK